MNKFEKAVANNDVVSCMEMAGYTTSHEDTEKFIGLMRARFYGFDNTLMSKVKKPEYYGVVLHPDGYDILRPLVKNYDDGHKWKHRLMCRLPSDDYRRVLDCFRRDGYSTIQDGLYALLRNYAEIED